MNITKNTDILRPPLKWLGSKLSQAPAIINEFPIIPDLKGRYVEPFVGGGGVWLRYDANENVLNDNDPDLISFWSLDNEDFKLFKDIIISIESARTKGGCLIDDFKIRAMQAVRELHPDIDISTANKIISQEHIRRIAKIAKYNISSDDEYEIKKIVNTGINSVIYYICRHAWNKSLSQELDKNKRVVRTALWFTIRELAYCGVFRLNPLGEMNMSYGGVTYDTKDLMSKIEILEKVRGLDLYDRSRFYCSDYKDFLSNIAPDKNDLIFADPPFEGFTFSMRQHEELAHTLLNLESKIVLTTRESDIAIHNLYPKWTRIDCDKTGTGVSILGRARTRNKLSLLKNW